MPRRRDLESILIIGSGPIVIGQACEFDYSGTQAVKALKRDGFRVVLVNSNPATIMTDPELADASYVEPLTAEFVEKVIERERPQALLPTVGGQTALNLAMELSERGTLERWGVELIGARYEAIKVAEDRGLFKQAMEELGLKVPRSGYARTLGDAEAIVASIGYPVILRPSFTLGGSGGGIAYNAEELRELTLAGLAFSPVRQVLVEESVIGWKEYELEVMRDLADNVIIVCSIENVDAMGIHTGDSITVAPQQTLSDREYQAMRDDAKRIIRKVGVETGGSNIQFAVDPRSGERYVIEMNPRVSRSSSLASKATGFPIAKIAALLAVGYRLDEIKNDITGETPACFEPALDYVVVKIPRWAFEKFPQADPTLNVQMKSVGEVMAMGRSFKEALQKALRSLEIDRDGLESPSRSPLESDAPEHLDAGLLAHKLAVPNWERIFYIRHAMLAGWSLPRIAALTRIDLWFLREMAQIVEMEGRLRSFALASLPTETLFEAKAFGFSDRQLARLTGATPGMVAARRNELGIHPVYKRVDTCAAEFEARTPYFYSTYETETEVEPTDNPKVLVLGSGPNRIGQGIEFDYACVHAAQGLRELGYETIMLNCNPETVSTDYDTSDRLYFEPITLEDVLEVVRAEQPRGVIVQFGGQTPLKLALALESAGVPIWGTSPDSIDLAEDRRRFGALAEELGVRVPENGSATSEREARAVADLIGYPLVVRPSYVLGGRAMAVVFDEASLLRYMASAVKVSADHPILIDRFLEDAFELDVDALGDGERVVVAGIMQHIEEAGIHSGDSACVLPPYMVSKRHLDQIRDLTVRLGIALGVRGLMNAQFALKDDVIYCLEVNPRASRTVPFVAKAVGIPLARLAAKIAAGKTLAELGFTSEPVPARFNVKAPVFPFRKFPGQDVLLGPEMRSTGEVMGIAATFGEAFAKAAIATGITLPQSGAAFLSVNDPDKRNIVSIARGLAELGFQLLATEGTARALAEAGLAARHVFKVNEGRPNIQDLLINGEVQLIVNTPLGRVSFYDDAVLRRTATAMNIQCITTLSGASACVEALKALRQGTPGVAPLQELTVAADPNPKPLAVAARE